MIKKDAGDRPNSLTSTPELNAEKTSGDFPVATGPNTPA